MFVYIGTYTNGKSRGIYRASFEPSTGKLTLDDATGGVQSPSFLAISPGGRFLYAVEEVDAGQVAAFSIERSTGALTFLNRQSARGIWPCHIRLDRTGRYALVANYGSGNFAVLPIAADGTLKPVSDVAAHTGKGPNAQRQEGAHGHSINLTRDDRFALACDLGLDSVFVYRFDAGAGRLIANDPPAAILPPGSGPRHLALHPNGTLVLVNSELLGRVTSFRLDPRRGTLTALDSQTTLPDGFRGENTTAEVAIHPGGRFAYVSNRGDDSLAIFGVDGKSGKLTRLGHQSTQGRTPRNFVIAPGGRFLLAANQATDDVVVFRIDENTGGLTPIGQRIAVPSPVCVRFLTP
jgi:6-phosphogluconolactonase